MRLMSKPYLQQIEHAELLLSELHAIKHWDDTYWKNRQHFWWETVALVGRFQRRLEILNELAAIIVTLKSDREEYSSIPQDRRAS
jgi:hypothetical protein